MCINKRKINKYGVQCQRSAASKIYSCTGDCNGYVHTHCIGFEKIASHYIDLSKCFLKYTCRKCENIKTSTYWTNELEKIHLSINDLKDSFNRKINLNETTIASAVDRVDDLAKEMDDLEKENHTRYSKLIDCIANMKTDVINAIPEHISTEINMGHDLN